MLNPLILALAGDAQVSGCYLYDASCLPWLTVTIHSRIRKQIALSLYDNSLLVSSAFPTSLSFSNLTPRSDILYVQYNTTTIYTSPPSPLKKPSWPEELVPSFIILSASPTCFRSDTSRPLNDFRFICLNRGANPWGDRPCIPLIAAGCYCRGSEELESRLRWR